MGDVISIPGLNKSDTWDVKCHARVAIRNDHGELQYDDEGKVLTRQCRNWAVRFAMVCHAHGAGGTVENNPTKAKAARTRDELRDRLRELGDAAVEQLKGILEQPIGAGPQAEVKANDKLKAIEMILERFVPKKLETESTVHTDVQDLDAEIEAAIGEIALGNDEEDVEDTG